MASSNRDRSTGTTPHPASAPNREALMTLPACRARALKSAATSRLEPLRAASSRPALSTRPSPRASFSSIE